MASSIRTPCYIATTRLFCLLIEFEDLTNAPWDVFILPCVSFFQHLKVTGETELTFEYQVRSRDERRAMGLETDGKLLSSPINTQAAQAAARRTSMASGAAHAHTPLGPAIAPAPASTALVAAPVGTSPEPAPSQPPVSRQDTKTSEAASYLPFQVSGR